jgi:hypothetical protein
LGFALFWWRFDFQIFKSRSNFVFWCFKEGLVKSFCYVWLFDPKEEEEEEEKKKTKSLSRFS